MKTKARTRRKNRKIPSCSKFVFFHLSDAEDHAIETEARTGNRMRVYYCKDHQGYHVTHDRF